MSAYFCNPETFSMVATSFLEAIEKHEIKVDKEYNYDDLIKELQDLNNYSLTERYGPEEAQPIAENIPKHRAGTLKQKIDNLKEYLYQCSVDDAKNQELYKVLRRFEVVLLNKFYRNNSN